MVKVINLKPFQHAFFCSRARFPGFLAGWGTGKTMVAILKGILLSSIYDNNLGLIVRSKFTDLRDSTLKDFERYTGLHVPMSSKEVTIPGTNSVIMFRHGEELSGLQNINLGWCYMEQAEEFATSEQFDLIRGRLRRELDVVKDYKCTEPAYDELIQGLKSDPLRQLMIGANAAGHCWTWRRWVKDRQSDYELHEATSFDNSDNLPADFISDLRTMERDNIGKYKRYVLNSHDDFERQGSYWAPSIGALRRTNPPQIGFVPFNPAYSVHTAWDVGYTTCVWMFQVIGQSRYYIRYYENYGEGIKHYCEQLDKWKKDFGYYYGRHFGPWDVTNPAHRATEGKTVMEVAAEHGVNFVKMPMDKDVNNSIKHVEKILPLCWFDAKNCEMGLDALEWFHEKKNDRMSTDNRPYFIDMPEKDWSEHCAKTFIISDQGIPFIDQNSRSITKEQIAKWQKRYGLTG